MANVKLKFYGTEKSETEDHSLLAYSNIHGEMYLCIDMPGFDKSFICLDRSTSIALVKELKKQIGFLESEVLND